MPFDVTLHERAIRHYPEVLGPGVIQRRLRQLVGYPVPAQRLRDLGMDEDDRVTPAPVLDQREVSPHYGFEARVRFVVFYTQLVEIDLHAPFPSQSNIYSVDFGRPVA